MLLPRRTLLLGLAALGVGLSILLWPSRAPDAGWEAYAHALSVSAARKMAADAKAFRQADSALAQRDGTVTQTIVRYRTLRDTLNIHDTTEVIRFVERSDSVVRACTELQNACAVYRVRAESVIADLHVENDALHAEVKALHPSRLGKAWDRVKMPLAFVGGVYLGSRVIR